MRFSIEKNLMYALIIVIIIAFGFGVYLFFSYSARGIKVETPNGGEELEVDNPYQISWQARGIKKIGIALYKGDSPQWIVKNIDAKQKKYEWKIQPWQEFGSDYQVAVFEYPWKKGNKIDFSDGNFAIIYPKSSSCEEFSIEKSWPYIQSDFPNLRRVFITQESYTGNLKGLEGADNICQREAEEQGLGGQWQAFLGDDQNSAVKRLSRLEGIFVEAKPALELPYQKGCLRLLGRDFDDFLKKFSNSLIVNQQKLTKEFLADLPNIWLGRLDEESEKNCTVIRKALLDIYKPLSQKYSYTLTCQNWTQGETLIKEKEPGEDHPVCYTPGGRRTAAVGLGALATSLSGKGEAPLDSFITTEGKYCSNPQKLLCIEE